MDGERRDWTSGGNSIGVHILLCVSGHWGVSVSHPEPSLAPCGALEEWGGEGRGAQEAGMHAWI